MKQSLNNREKTSQDADYLHQKLADVEKQLAAEREARARLELALRTYEEDFSSALAQGGAAIYRRNFISGKFDFVSNSIEQLTGYKPSEFTPELWEASTEQMGFVGELAGVKVETALKKYRTGKVETWRSEELFRTRSGEKKWLLDLSTGIRDKKGNQIGTIGILTDITDLKEAQKRERILQEEIAKARQMESVGMLAGTVAHELNNLLLPVIGYSDLLVTEIREDSQIKEYARLISESGKKAVASISDLLALARREPPVFQPVHLNTVIEDYVESKTFSDLTAANPNVDVRLNLASVVPIILGSYNSVTRVINNFVINAFDAIRENGRIVISTSVEHLLVAIPGTEVDKGDYVVLKIEDNGVGMDSEELSHIFEPFYVKRKMGSSSSGLGLAAAYGIIKDLKGHITTKSTPGEGTDFTIYYPIAQKSNTTEKQEDNDLTGSESILVIDDEDNPRDIAVRLLSRLGYQVTGARNGREAVALIETSDKNTPFDLLLLDMIMEPDFDGLDTYRAIKKLNPDQKCVICSGYSESERAREVLSLGAGQFLSKPYTFDQLGKSVREVLDT